MDWLTGLLSIGGGIVVATVLFFGIVVGLPVWLHHRRTMAKIKGTGAEKIAALRQEIEQLHQRCERLERDVTTLHTEMADETRTLDRKLNAILPDGTEAKTVGPAPEKPAQDDERVRTQ